MGKIISFITNRTHTILYMSVTSYNVRRIDGQIFFNFPRTYTDRYNQVKLVYYEVYHNSEEAVQREKMLRKASREKKMELINQFNPDWDDLVQDVEYLANASNSIRA